MTIGISPDFSREGLYRRMLTEIIEERPVTADDYGHTLFPPQICVEMTAACNLRCTFCGRNHMERPKGHMSRALWHKIVDEVANESPMTEILPNYMGEALLLGDELFDRLATARRMGCKKITMNTNGTFLEKYVPRLVDGSLDRIAVSCDAHTQETYAKVRPGKGGGLEAIYRGMDLLLDAIRQRGDGRPFVEATFTVFDYNEHEAEDFAKHWLERGVIVKTRPKGFYAGLVPGGDFRMTTGAQRNPCNWLRDTLIITWNGLVVLCACDVDSKVIVGNVQTQTIREIWNSAIKVVRDLHQQRRWADLPEICRKCTDWQSRRSHTFFPDESLQRDYLDFVRGGRLWTYDQGSATALPEVE